MLNETNSAVIDTRSGSVNVLGFSHEGVRKEMKKKMFNVNINHVRQVLELDHITSYATD